MILDPLDRKKVIGMLSVLNAATGTSLCISDLEQIFVFRIDSKQFSGLSKPLNKLNKDNIDKRPYFRKFEKRRRK